MKQLEPREEWAWELGELLDQAIRRYDIWHFTYKEPPPPPTPPELFEMTDWYAVGSPSSEDTNSHSHPLRMANHMPQSGELPLPNGWALEIVKLCEKAGVEGRDLKEVAQATNRVGEKGGLESGVTEVDERIRTALTQNVAIDVGQAIQPNNEAKSALSPIDQTSSSSGTVESLDSKEHQSLPAHTKTDVETPPPLKWRKPVDRKDYARLLAIKKKIDPKNEYIGTSFPILRVFEQIEELNNSDSKIVVLNGPTGAGKTCLARLIHEHSDRSGSKFLDLNAADVLGQDEGVIKQQWQGYGKGAAIQNANNEGIPGYFEEFCGGTIFFDEVAELPDWFQGYCRRILDKREIRPVAGSGDPFTPNVRLIFATHKKLEDAVFDKAFKHDLYRRIKAYIVELPSVKERKDDIPLFIEAKKGRHKVTAQFLLAMLRYDWIDGNVGELNDVLEGAIRKTHKEDDPLTAELIDLPTSGDANLLEREDAQTEAMFELCKILVPQGYKKQNRGGLALQKRIHDITGWSIGFVSRLYNEVESLHPTYFATG